MKFDPDSNNEGHESMSSLRFKVAELERKYLEEKDRYRRDCLALKETVARLEEDRRTLRERELKDQQKIKSLLEQIAAKEREFTQKVVEHNMWVKKCGELEAQLSKLVSKAAVEFEKKERELKEKFVQVSQRNRQLEENAAKAAKGKEYGELEARILKIVEERFHLVEKAKGVESANGKGQSFDKAGGKTALEMECFTQQKSSLGPTRQRVSVVVDNDGERDCRDSDAEEDEIPLSQLRNDKLPVVAEANQDLGPLSEFGSNAGKSNLSEVADARTPTESANNTRKVADKGFQASRTRNSTNQYTQRAYTGRIPSSDQASRAKKRAETLQSSLMSCNLSFVRPMAPSHVSGGFWLNLPIKFCKENLPVHNLEMILEDERSLEYKVNFIGHNPSLSGGWKGFALAHNLELGDVLLFELHKPARFKVYIVKAIPEESPEDFDDKISGEHIDGAGKLADTDATENQDIDLCDFQMKPPKAEQVTPTGRESGTNTCKKSFLFRACT